MRSKAKACAPFGLDGRDPRIARGTRFSESTPLIRAACAGQGLALVRDIYVEKALQPAGWR
ncbi:MAG: hypothetical protein JO122_19470 [Acetobacteraceae bacterium]|nr:hypothetical protein [Acetobacteraceae bacterium]